MWQINSKSRLPLMKKKPVCYKMMIKHTPLINSPKKSAHQLSLSSIHENFENDVDGTRGSPQNSNFFFYIIFNIQNIIPKKLCITYLMIVKKSHIIFPLSLLSNNPWDETSFYVFTHLSLGWWFSHAMSIRWCSRSSDVW